MVAYNFFANIYNHPAINKEDHNRISSAHREVQFSKIEIILSEGNRNNAYYLIEKGIFRSFVFDYNGNEITTNFFAENEILIEVPSLFLRIPSSENLQALTDTTVWKIEFDVFQELFLSIEGFADWGRSWMSNELFIAKQRATNMITQSATERYLKMEKEQPEIIQQVPLKFIASFLGVTDSSLSRIRKEISQNK